MKIITSRIVLAVFALGLCSALLAEAPQEYPRVAFCGPGGSPNPTPRSDYVILVAEGSGFSYEAVPIPSAEVVAFVDHLLKEKNVSYVAVYPREGIKFGDVVHAVDVLRGTKAKNIGVSMVEIAIGREP